jgi:pimeloyl-ACP methyl ester carboxylesterase
MTIVLVHGAWGGSWTWREVASRLSAAGHEVHAPTLTGLAERSHVAPEDVNLSSHIADIAGLLHYENLSNVMLVGHSYGGMVVTGAADREPDRIAGVCYIDAFVPHSGQSLFDLSGPERAASHRAAAQAHDGGHSVPRPANPANSMPSSAAQFGHLFTPQPLATMSEPFVAKNPGRVPAQRHYALCRAYNPSPFHAIAARVKTQPEWTYSEFDALHDLIRTHPDEVSQLVLKLARRWSVGTA